MLTVQRTAGALGSILLSLGFVLAVTLVAQGAPSPSPGDQMSLVSHHPSYDLMTIHPSGEQPMVGGLDFLSDGRLVVTYMDQIGRAAGRGRGELWDTGDA